MALDFPNSPTVGQVFTVSGAAWTWDGVKWTAGTSVMPMNDNRIINGDMRIDQRNNGASGATTGYTIDRWQYYGSQANKFNWQRNAGPITTQAQFPYYFGFISTSAYAVLTNDLFAFYQSIEADMVSDFAWGTASAQPVTLSFWVQSSLTGTFSGAITNAANTRSYPFTYSISTAAAWTKIAVTIPGDTAGTWVMSGNGLAFSVKFDLGSGVTNRGPANAWASANYNGANGAVSVVATNSANFFLTGVKLEIGSVATPYPRQSLAKSMADCQRYYQAWLLNYVAMGYNTAGSAVYGMHGLPVFMRAAPTVAFANQSYNNCSALAVLIGNQDRLSVYATVTATGTAYVNSNVTLSAEL
jgi:hypothetical protein